MKRTSIKFVFSGVIIILVVIISMKVYNNKKVYVALVNGEPISIKEYLSMLDKEKSKVFVYFADKYSINDSKKFWYNTYDGEKPIDIAKEQALNKCISNKIQQILANEYGVLKDISYEAFLRDLEEENISRQNAVKENKIIYGPIKYDENTYFDYRFNNMIISLKDKMLGDKIIIEEKEIQRFYDENKSKMFKQCDDIEVKVISLKYINNEGDISNNKEKYKKQFEEIINEIQHKNIDNILNKYNQKHNLVIYDKNFNDSTIRNDLKYNTEMYEVANGLLVGEISNVIETNGTLNALLCTKRQQGEYDNFNDIKDYIHNIILDEKYNQIILNMQKKATVTINEKVYNKIMIEKILYN